MPIFRAPDDKHRKSMLFPFTTSSNRSSRQLPGQQILSSPPSNDHPFSPVAFTNLSTQSTPELLCTPAEHEALHPSPQPNTPATKDRKKRKSWLSTSAKLHDLPAKPVRAWVGGHQGRLAYSVSELANGCHIPELWDASGDTLVYLFPLSSGKGPSFRIHSSFIASSLVLTALTGQLHSLPRHSAQTLSTDIQDAPRWDSTPGYDHANPTLGKETMVLVLPLNLSASSPCTESSVSADALDALVAARNLIAFLLGQSLVCTERCPSLFLSFLDIADRLKVYGFTNIDGSTYGEVPTQSFHTYVNELGLADVRGSHEKTLEALILGERMRSVMLYNEAFTHAAGKYRSIQHAIKQPRGLPHFHMLPDSTRHRLERAAIDLDSRRKNIEARLSDFEFPSVFAGIMSSKTAVERKQISFSAWKSAFGAMRKQVLSYYKLQYGSWPPKANRKTQLETSALNRLVLMSLYRDFADLYDLWVDRTALTSRTADLKMDDSSQPVHRVLRRICDEYDRSVPPVQPPIPFDVPLLPSLYLTRSDYGADTKMDQKARHKQLKFPEIERLLGSAANPDARAASQRSPFVAAMTNWERKQARGCTLNEICDLRCGAWIFLYVVIQSLPMVVVDAPAVRFHTGVEYFLCEPPRSGVPWAGGQSGTGRQSFYRIAGGGDRIVSLPSDLIEHGVEGIYRRSHCWLMAAKWSHEPRFADATSALQREQEQASSPLANSHVVSGAQYSLLDASPSQVASLLPSHGTLSAGMYGSRIPSYPDTHLGSRSDIEYITSGSGHWASQGSSPYQSRPATPTQALERGRQRDSVLALGLEALPIPHAMLSSAAKTASDTGRGSAGAGESHEPTETTFDDIIAGLPDEINGMAKIQGNSKLDRS